MGGPGMTLCPLALQARGSREGLVGRPSELAAIRQELATAARGSLACVTIEGEPGIGKTRLLSAAQDLVSAENFLVVAVPALVLEQPADGQVGDGGELLQRQTVLMSARP